MTLCTPQRLGKGLLSTPRRGATALASTAKRSYHTERSTPLVNQYQAAAFFLQADRDRFSCPWDAEVLVAALEMTSDGSDDRLGRLGNGPKMAGKLQCGLGVGGRGRELRI